MTMTRAMRRTSSKEGKRLQALPWNEFKDVTVEAHERHLLLNPGSTYRPDKVFKNNHYVVQCFYAKKMLGYTCIKAMVRRNDEGKCGWAELQRVKNQLFGEEVEAFQMFPKQSNLTDVANIYWLYVPLDSLVLDNVYGLSVSEG